MQLLIASALLVVALVIISVALHRLRVSGYRPEAKKSVQPILLAGSACSMLAAVLMFTS
ncbi:UNVERIFIED_ORG: hypothetical protein EDC92_1241 [Dietzia maris]|jgi:hypothetical protein|uniref:hypothetical protein n=1 Tax=Dietzia maris TaxID=37915 RepID=UPI0010F30BA1